MRAAENLGRFSPCKTQASPKMSKNGTDIPSAPSHRFSPSPTTNYTGFDP